MTQITPSPSHANDNVSSESQHSGRRTKGPRIPTRDDILELLNRLNGMVLMGMISVPKAKIIQQNLQIQLKALTQQPQAEMQRELSMEDLGEALRRDPSLGKLFEGFLSDDQIECLLRQPPDAPES
jgi:hypothetical protein